MLDGKIQIIRLIVSIFNHARGVMELRIVMFLNQIHES